MARGRFWVIEGMDGSGKSTQARLLADALREAGGAPLALREPGATPLGESLRALLLRRDPRHGAWSPRAEALLFFAARVELLERVVAPALAAGRDVVCERFSPSTLAYQGQESADAEFVLALERACVPARLQPDRVLLLDLPAEESLRRALAGAHARGEGPDAIEARGLAFQERVRDGYLRYARAHPQRCTVVPVSGLSETEVAARIAAALGMEVRR